ncbi:hypothetical protein [Candidatus Nephthysia bennettiae]|uniref:hypothetical protein n=1 Tax=Candidatus Nephthysia bennettiae TaxID=3127016 RepID=UPI001A338D03|nr:hypothetical protein [Candidatus Dormibacteraeota bacterium]
MSRLKSRETGSTGDPGFSTPRRRAALAASAIILVALLAAAGVLYWRITSSYNAAAVARHVPSPSPSVITAPSVIGSVTVSSKVDFNCTLPVTVYSRRVRVGMPSGTVTLDGVLSADGSAVTENSYRDGRWMPVPPGWVSPDGASYAAIAPAVGNSTQQAIVLTNAATGERQEVWRGASRPSIVGWDAMVLYFMLQPQTTGQSGQSDTGLWLTRPSNPGQARRVGPDPTSVAAISPARALFTGDAKLGGGAAWDTTQAVGASRARVERMDLQTGTVSVWYTAPAGVSVFILGFDRDGHPVLALTGSNRSSSKGLMLLTGVNQTLQIGGEGAGAPRFASAFGDAQGIWVGASGSLWLYRSGALFKVADLPVAATGGQTPMAIDNAPGGSGELPPTRIGGPCT